VSGFGSTPLQAQENAAPAVDQAGTWDITPFCPSKDAWDAEFERLAANIEGLVPYEGRLGDDAATLFKALELRSAFTKELSRMGVYASIGLRPSMRFGALGVSMKARSALLSTVKCRAMSVRRKHTAMKTRSNISFRAITSRRRCIVRLSESRMTASIDRMDAVMDEIEAILKTQGM